MVPHGGTGFKVVARDNRALAGSGSNGVNTSKRRRTFIAGFVAAACSLAVLGPALLRPG